MTTRLLRAAEARSQPVAAPPTPVAGTRSKTVWPFLSTSIWNTSLGTGATLSIGPQKPPDQPGSAFVYDDPVYVVQVSSSDPFVPLYTPSSWLPELPGTNTGTTIQIPNSFTLPDHTSSSQPNNHTILIQPDGETILMLVGVVRPTAGGNVYAYKSTGLAYQTALTTGDGRLGTHASGLNALGGALRDIDFTGAAIYHALNIELNEYLNYKWGGSQATSYVWPATQTDGYASATTYGGSNPSLPSYCKIGMLMCLPRSQVYADYSVTTNYGKRIFDALQTYGAYATESVGSPTWNAANVVIRADALAARAAFGFSQTSRDEIARMIGGLYVVTNNSAISIGGGGTPYGPAVPPFG